MNERIVTIDGKDYPLGDDFMVVATQNPIEQQGTYPLPEAQLDRFLFKVDRRLIRAATRSGRSCAGTAIAPPCRGSRISGSRRSPTRATLAEMRDAVTRIRLSDPLVDYIVDVIRATREHSSLEVGASTRAANMLASAARAFAALQGRDFVIPDDMKILALPVLRHRLTMSPSAEIEGR